jgi:hypothetical protein
LAALRSKKKGKVPAFKFSSNDGWTITPEDCVIIAYRLLLYLADGSPAGTDNRNFVEGPCRLQ